MKLPFWRSKTVLSILARFRVRMPYARLGGMQGRGGDFIGMQGVCKRLAALKFSLLDQFLEVGRLTPPPTFLKVKIFARMYKQGVLRAVEFIAWRGL
jgi:hypothetical protein